MGQLSASQGGDMAGSTLKWHAVETKVEAVYRQLSAALSETDFYLAGGTALALQEGHRISIDLDLMSPSFDDPERLIHDLRDGELSFKTTYTSSRTLYVNLGGVQVSFFGYHYPQLRALEETAPGLLPLAHRDDIAAMKLAAIAARGSRKDFIDLWILVSRHDSLAEYLGFYQRKYDSRDVGHVVRSLTYFDDAELEPDPRLLIEIKWSGIKADFLTWVAGLLPE